eukprot:c21820_g1_i1 orf=603-2219(+)
MLPSWFTKLRDVKAGSKHKQLNKPYLSPSPSLKKRDEDPASFAKSLSLQRASSKARNARFEAGITSACTNKYDSRPSIGDESEPCKGAQNVCNSKASELGIDATGALLMHHFARVDPWDRDCIPVSNCKSASKLLLSKESKASVQKGHGVSDNDTEDFALTSETRSSFCSETSSADSTVSCKYGCEAEGHQDEQIWQEGEIFEAFKSPGIVRKNSQETCVEISGLKFAEGQKGSSCHAEISPDLMSRICQESAQIQRSLMSDTQEGEQSSLYANLTTSRHSRVSGNAKRNSRFFKSNGDKDSLLSKEKKDRYSYMENFSSLIKSYAGKASANSRESKENNAFLKNLTNIEHDRSHVDSQEIPGKVHEKSNANAVNLASNVDKHRHISDPPENSGLDTLAQYAWQQEQHGPHLFAESPSTNISSLCCAQQKSSKENLDGTRPVLSMRSRRQRGSSISAVLPPGLQGVVGDSFALVKMSDDPYEDFRKSMYEMIMEKDLEGSMDVEELLYCYLTLNSPEHHELIEEVFSDVWSAIMMTLR